MPTQPDMVRLKITLDAVKPTVMRRLEVPVDVTLDCLHETIQAIMPWDDSHPYAFRVRDRHWAIPVPDIHDGYGPIGDARETTLARVLSEPNFKVLVYTYDFGDDWQHSIKVERRFTAEPWEEFPGLIDARGRCPPEDVGGPWGYAEYLSAMSDPGHARHAHWLGWLGRRDPNEIDRTAMETALRRLVRVTDDRPGRGTRRA